MLTSGSWWSLLGILLSISSACFLLNDLKHRRTYLLVGGEDSSERKVVIRRDRSPVLFSIIVVGVALCTAFTLVTCLVLLLLGPVAPADLWKTLESWQVVLVFMPGALVVMYVLQSISVRVFTRWWDI